MPVESASFSVDGKTLGFTEVTKDNPASLAMNRDATISVAGRTLPEGPHKVTVGFVVVGLGDLSFDITDNVA